MAYWWEELCRGEWLPQSSALSLIYLSSLDSETQCNTLANIEDDIKVGETEISKDGIEIAKWLDLYMQNGRTM